MNWVTWVPGSACQSSLRRYLPRTSNLSTLTGTLESIRRLSFKEGPRPVCLYPYGRGVLLYQRIAIPHYVPERYPKKLAATHDDATVFRHYGFAASFFG